MPILWKKIDPYTFVSVIVLGEILYVHQRVTARSPAHPVDEIIGMSNDGNNSAVLILQTMSTCYCALSSNVGRTDSELLNDAISNKNATLVLKFCVPKMAVIDGVTLHAKIFVPVLFFFSSASSPTTCITRVLLSKQYIAGWNNLLFLNFD